MVSTERVRAAEATQPSNAALVWRRALLALCAFAIIATAISIRSGSIMSDSERGFQLAGASVVQPFMAHVSYVAPGGAGERSGLKAGDAIDLLRLSSTDRHRVINGVTPGERINIPILRGRQRLTIHYTGGYIPIRWDVWLDYAGAIWAALVAALLVWRRPGDPEARILCVLLLGLTFPSFFAPGNWASSSPRLDIALNVLASTILTMSVPLLASYALLFARPPSALRRILAVLSYLVAIAIVVLTIWLPAISIWNGTVPPGLAILTSPLFNSVVGAALWLLPLLCVLETARVAVNPERDRIFWTSVTIGAYYAWNAILNTILNAMPWLAGSPLLRNEQMVGDVFAFFMPVGMAYALLNRRVLDVGFALNRAVVFSGVSIIVVGVFVLVEWLVSDWMQTTSHSTNLLFSGGLALALGFSIRFVHGKVDYLVDHIFFRKRHKDEEAIRDMARQAPYITDRAILLRRVEQTLSENADASSVAILSRDESGTYGGFDQNDPAIVALRAYHKVLDLHTVATAITGEWAYPMIARGQLVAALVLGAKRSGESYAPDESAAIAELATSTAAALDVLSLEGQGQPDAALERIESLLVSVLHRLPQVPETQN